MATYIDIERARIHSAPTDTGIFYPEEDGIPMAASDLHRGILTRTIDTLTEHFLADASAYVSGDILMYYVEGVPAKSVSPDVLVTFGIESKPRHTYKVWEAGKVPEFVMEFSSVNTYHNDMGAKKELYASLGIRDYFLYDAEAKFLPSQLMGFTLVDRTYAAISAGESGGVQSAALNLEFHALDDGLGIYNPVTGKWLHSRAERTDIAEARTEIAEARAETAEERAETAEERAETAEERAETAEERAEREAAGRREEAAGRQEEAAGRKRAEAENALLREEIARLRIRR